MPQATDADRARYKQTFPDIGCEHAMQALEERGFKLTKQWNWIPPEGHKPTENELFWIGFLIDEWDFGGLETNEKA